MKIIIFLSSIFFAFFQAQAALDQGIEIGGRQQSGAVGGANFSANAMWGFQGGGFLHLPIGGAQHMRTGILYTQRPLESENLITGEKIQYHLDYLDIPLEVLFKPSEVMGFHFGLITSINLSAHCTGDVECRVVDVQALTFPFVGGFVFKPTPKLGFNAYIDGANFIVARGLGDYRAIGLNLMYSID
ncbi:MAG: PorT family protein [Pseudobdellovibrionaceae bacterium]